MRLSVLIVLLCASTAMGQECAPRAAVARPGGVQVVYGSAGGTTLTCLAGALGEVSYSQEKQWTGRPDGPESYGFAPGEAALPLDVSANCGGEAFSLIIMPPGTEEGRCFGSPVEFIPAITVPESAGTAMFEVSSSDMNRVSCLSGTISDFAFSREKIGDARLMGSGELLVTFATRNDDGRKIYATTPADLTFTCGGRSYSLVLVPKRIPSMVFEAGSRAQKPVALRMPATGPRPAAVLLLPVR